jgi:hypothetical protein
MAAIGPRGRHFPLSFVCGAALLSLGSAARADDAAEARDQISHIATALSEGDAADAMTPFDKSYPNYDKLRNFFAGLTHAFQIVNEIDISDEQDEKTQISLTVHWTLTLTDLQTNYTESRAADLDIKLVRLKGKWKIADLQPVDLFNPAGNRAPKASLGVHDAAQGFVVLSGDKLRFNPQARVVINLAQRIRRQDALRSN